MHTMSHTIKPPTMHDPIMHTMSHTTHYAPAKPHYHGGKGFKQVNKFVKKVKKVSPEEHIMEEIAQNRAAVEAANLKIEANRLAIEQVVASQSKLVYDYFNVNDAKLNLVG